MEIAGRLRPRVVATCCVRLAEVLHERRDGVGEFHRVEVLADDVLDQGELEPLALVGVAHEGRDALDAGALRGLPSPLARDQLVAAFGERAHDHRLHEAARAQRLGQCIQGRLVEAAARLVGVWPDRGDLELQQASAGRDAGGRRTAQERREAAAQSLWWVQPRSATSSGGLGVGGRSGRRGVVADHGLSMGWRLSETYVSWDDSPECEFAEMAPDFGDDLTADPRARVVHRHQHARDPQLGVERAPAPP